MSLLDALDTEPDLEEALVPLSPVTPDQHIARILGKHQPHPACSPGTTDRELAIFILAGRTFLGTNEMRTLPSALLESSTYRINPFRAVALYTMAETQLPSANIDWRLSTHRVVNRLCTDIASGLLRQEDAHRERFVRHRPRALPAAIAGIPPRADTIIYARHCVPLYAHVEAALEFAHDLTDLRSLAAANIFIEHFTLEANRIAARARINSGEVAPAVTCQYAALQYVIDLSSAMVDVVDR